MCYEPVVERADIAAKLPKAEERSALIGASPAGEPAVAPIDTSRRLSAKEFWDIIDPEPVDGL